MAERTGCPILLSLWSYVVADCLTEYLSDLRHVVWEFIGDHDAYERFCRTQ